MALKLYPEDSVQAIATAIRGKNGLSTTYKIGDMRAAITALPSGGGATNIVQGTFSVPFNKLGTTQNVTLNYTGSGYPIMAVVVVDGGMYTTGTLNTSTWYNSTHRYAVGQWVMTKANMSSTPLYNGSNTAANYRVVISRYKNSTSSATSYTNSSTNTAIIFGGTASASSTLCIRLTSATQLQYIISNTSYGLLEGVTYRYVVVYSS